MGTLGKLVCLGFGTIYIFGVLLFVLAPTIRRRLRAAMISRDRNKAHSE